MPTQPKTPKEIDKTLLEYEYTQWSEGVELIAGVDEVGRGALAGPMVVGAVILNKKHLYTTEDINNDVALEELRRLIEQYADIKDSKLLTSKKRELLSAFIKNESISYSVAQIENIELDKIGMSRATSEGFSKAVQNLDIKPGHVLTDAFKIPGISGKNQTNIVRGDRLSITIAAASIVAKVYRDTLMVEYAEKYPEYGFERHKGYGSKEHIEAIRVHGPCEIHRFSFEPIRSLHPTP